jgi:carbon storage regulator
MLILTRKPGESLYIGDVKVTIVELKGHQIRIGIDAPPEIRIYREEIYVQILEENRKAAEAAVSSGGLEGLPTHWKGKAAEGGAPAGGDDDSESKPKKPTLSGLSAFTTSFGASPGAKPGEGKGDSSPQVVIKRKRKKPDE